MTRVYPTGGDIPRRLGVAPRAARGADLVLDHEAVRLNELVYAREGFDRGDFYSKVVRRYLDFLPYLEVQRAAYRRRILDES